MLNIARSIYAAWDPKLIRPNQLPEAVVVPIGTSANEKRKIANVTAHYPHLAEHENVPLPGFTLYKASRQRWGSKDQTWLVIDPRGFMVRISNENLEDILHVTGITEGLIQEKCVWAREDAQTTMTLVPVSSPTYIEAKEGTELIEGKVGLRDVQVGDKVILQNGLKGTYMGVLSMYGPVYANSGATFKPQVFLRRQIIEVEPHKYHYGIDLKILKVIEKTETPSTRQESAKKMNEEITAGTAYFTPSTNMTPTTYWAGRGKIDYVSVHAVPKVTMTFEEIDQLEATRLFHDAHADLDIGKLLVANASSIYPLAIDFPYSTSASRSCTITNFEVVKASTDLKPTEALVLKDSKRATYRSAGGMTYSLDKFTKFYKIVKNIKNETYI
jgi:hypothetical protein